MISCSICLPPFRTILCISIVFFYAHSPLRAPCWVSTIQAPVFLLCPQISFPLISVLTPYSWWGWGRMDHSEQLINRLHVTGDYTNLGPKSERKWWYKRQFCKGVKIEWGRERILSQSRVSQTWLRLTFCAGLFRVMRGCPGYPRTLSSTIRSCSLDASSDCNQHCQMSRTTTVDIFKFFFFVLPCLFWLLS